MVKISAMITTFNEEKSIGKCLDSVKNVVDEIVVVHCGNCVDKTLDIARKYTSKVFVDVDYGVACPNRPFGFSKCTGDWVLQLDADESISEDIKKNLRKLAEQEAVDAYAFRWLDNDDISIFGRKVKRYKPVFFRKSKLINEGIVNEPTKTSGMLQRSELILIHEPEQQLMTASVYEKKINRWSCTDAKYRIEHNKAPHSHWFYLIKAPVWFFVYIIYYYVFKLYLLAGVRGIQLGFFHAKYNFKLNYLLFKFKKK